MSEKKDKICAIITAHNSGESIAEVLPAISPQVEQAVIVDDASTAENFTLLQKAAAGFGNVFIIRNPVNQGLGGALNRGAEYALSHNYEWMLTLDDNSKAAPDMIQKMFAAYELLPPEAREKTAIIAPNYTTLKGPVYTSENPFFVSTTITAGQLVKTASWKSIGGYKENLIIGAIDHDFSFRLLRAGYKILLAPSAVLEETPGPQPAVRSLFGKKFVVPGYSPGRYYYIYRNNVYLYKTYWRLVPKWIAANLLSDMVSLVKIIIFESQKISKIAAIIRGYADGWRGKLGKLKG